MTKTISFRSTLLTRLVTLMFVGLALLLARPSTAEDQKSPKLSIGQLLGGFDGIGGEDDKQVTITAKMTAKNGGPEGELEIVTKIAAGWHVYALTQPKVLGAAPTTIAIVSTPKIELLADFTANPKPTERIEPTLKSRLVEHANQVTWTAPVRLPRGFNIDSDKVQVSILGSVCKDRCVNIDQTIDVALVGFQQEALESKREVKSSVGEYRADYSHVVLKGHLEPKVVTPGGKAKLILTAVVDSKYHVYPYRATESKKPGSKPTLIAISKTPNWNVSAPVAQPAPDRRAGKQPHHKGMVSWTVELDVPADAPPGEYEIAGAIGYQSCAATCDPATGVAFTGQVSVGNATQTEATPLHFTSARYEEVAELADRIAGVEPKPPVETGPASVVAPPKVARKHERVDPGNIEVVANDGGDRSFLSAILIAMLGGFILNFMPCVLPVIGLKVMSFVKQAGNNRAKAMMLNVWYSLGLLSVFMVLATLAVVASFGWGEQNQYGAFNITMAAIVFAMGLSFLGVWEIPIPGFAGSGTATELTEQEGPLGAFLKGIITTILAVPCSGPGIATALAWCTGKPGPLVYLVFASMALGMASPYLIAGMYPQLLKFIPKPGIWMETFKELMGFVLLATVVFMLSYLAWYDVVPTVALLFGIWFACWYIGRTPITVSPGARQRAWAISIFIVAMTATFAFTKLRTTMEDRFNVALDIAAVKASYNTDEEKPKVIPFSVAKLHELTDSGKTVLVDFTADWCITCKILEATVLKTDAIQDSLKDREIVTMVADWTNREEEITKMLSLLGSKQVPVLAFFPAKNPHKAFVIRGGYTQSSLEEVIKQATGTSTSNSNPEAKAVGMNVTGKDVK